MPLALVVHYREQPQPAVTRKSACLETPSLQLCVQETALACNIAGKKSASAWKATTCPEGVQRVEALIFAHTAACTLLQRWDFDVPRCQGHIVLA